MDKKEIEKELKKKKKVQRIKKLKLQEGEIYLGDLRPQEQYQVLIRHMNNITSLLNIIATCESQTALCLQKLCKKNGIDIDKE